MATTLPFSEWAKRFGRWTGREPQNDLALHAHAVDQPAVREAARASRRELVAKVDHELGPFDPRHLRALLEVPRERFVRPVDVALSAEDTPLPLDAAGLATISAPHAYLLSYRLAELAPGDVLVELGSGTGYGAALGSAIVGPEGRVITFEIDGALARRAEALLDQYPNVTVVHGDAMESTEVLRAASKVVVTFAVSELHGGFLDALREGATLVAPVGRGDEQRLLRVVKRDGVPLVSDHGGVRYVRNRSLRS
jgi:protein-L-isoaspartate(D-aspartate) O-methyltransferase